MSRIIFHIDVNSAYLSWTAVEQLKSGAKLDIRTIPRHHRRGPEIQTRRRAGQIHPGKKVWDTHRGAGGKCSAEMSGYPHGAANHALYHEYSRRLMDFLPHLHAGYRAGQRGRVLPDFTGIAQRYHSCVSAAFEIKDRVRE